MNAEVRCLIFSDTDHQPLDCCKPSTIVLDDGAGIRWDGSIHKDV